jgi:ATP-dependent DNA ligase
VGDGDLHPPIEPMKVTSVAEWPPGRDWRFEMKLDGWRLLAFRQARRVFLQSRAGRDLSRYFPDLAEAIGEAFPPWTVLDGEVVIWSGDRADFAALQRRITVGVEPETPAHLVAFDILQHPARGILLSSPLTARRQLLEDLLADAPLAIPLCPNTDHLDEAQEWMTGGAEGIGIEGVVIKRARSRYRPGGTSRHPDSRPGRRWRHRHTRPPTHAAARATGRRSAVLRRADDRAVRPCGGRRRADVRPAPHHRRSALLAAAAAGAVGRLSSG